MYAGVGVHVAEGGSSPEKKPQAEWGHLAPHHPETSLRELGVGFGWFVYVFMSVDSGR